MSTLGWDYLRAEDTATILKGIRAGTAFGGPYHVEIHPAGRCNVECFFCSTASLRADDQMATPSFLALIEELESLGTRSVRLSGGGEPLFHQNIDLILERLEQANLRIENLTTNGVLLRSRAAEQLSRNCDKITISLNAGDAESYGEMMQTSPKNFDRILQNVSALASAKPRPRLNLQFLVWKGNYRQIPEMYDLARRLGVDTILFNGIAFLPPEKRMSQEERAEMLALYEQLIERDELRTIESITSYEDPIDDDIAKIAHRVSEKRNERPFLSKVREFLFDDDFTVIDKLRHRRSIRERRKISTETAGFVDDCVIAWHSLVVKTNGDVSPCCILQHRRLGNVFRDSVEGVWYGELYQQFRAELREILDRHEAWEPSVDSIAVPMCAGKTTERCPIRTIYRPDIPFARALTELSHPTQP